MDSTPDSHVTATRNDPDAQENTVYTVKNFDLKTLLRKYRDNDDDTEVNLRDNMIQELRRLREHSEQESEAEEAKLQQAENDWLVDISWVFAEIAHYNEIGEDRAEAQAYFRRRVFKLYAEDRVNEFFERMKELKTPDDTRMAVRDRFQCLLGAKNWKDKKMTVLRNALDDLEVPAGQVSGLSGIKKYLITYAKIFVRYYGQKWADWKDSMIEAFKGRLLFERYRPTLSLNRQVRMVLNSILEKLIRDAEGYDKLKSYLRSALKTAKDGYAFLGSTPDTRKSQRIIAKGLDSDELAEIFAAYAILSDSDGTIRHEDAKIFMLKHEYVVKLINDLAPIDANPRTVLLAAMDKLPSVGGWPDDFYVKLVSLSNSLQKFDGYPMNGSQVRKSVVDFTELSEVSWTNTLAKMINNVINLKWASGKKNSESKKKTPEKKVDAETDEETETDEDTETRKRTKKAAATGSSGKKGVSRKSSKTAPILTEEEKKTRTDLVRALVDKVKSQADESKQREDIMTAIGALKVGDKGMSTKTTSEIDKKLTTMEAVKRFSPVLWVKYYTNAIGAEFTEEFAKELTKKRTKKAAATGKGGDTRAQRFAQDLLAMLNAFDEAIEQS